MPETRHHAPIVGELPVPHGAQEYSTIDGEIINESDDFNVQDIDPKNEKAIFAHILHPEDSFNQDGIYWADLPFGQRLSFLRSIDNAEAKRELSLLWSTFKADPLEPMRMYFRSSVLPGAGLGLEGFVLFSIGNLTSLFSAAWPHCWKTYDVCNKNWVAAVTYLETIGIIFGQVMVGFIGDGLGRKWGLVQDALIMVLGLVMLIASWGNTLNGWVICYAWSLFVYSVGVGGEYPMTATAGMENAKVNRASTAQDRLHRGRKVVLAFLMQGWGQFFNQVILILLLLIFHGGGNPPYTALSAQWTFRISFVFPAVGTAWLAYYRYFKVKYPSAALDRAKRDNHVTGYDTKSLKLVLKNFGPRLIATAGAWFCNDVFFYGNKLFQSKFIKVIAPNSKSIVLGWLYNLINVGVEMAGYYLAAFLVDHKLFGRNNMMQLGFLMCFILFVVPAFNYKYYTEAANIKKFQAMYFLSSFFNQFGPNCVTFLVAAEVFPTPVRATAHGLSAACGKLGALFASVLYNYITDQQKFYIVPWFGLAGMLLVFLFMPDTTGLDLVEQDRRWQFIRNGNPQDYHGVAIHPTHLSLWERLRGHGKNYDPQLDYKQKVDSLRKDWEDAQRAKHSESDNTAMDDVEEKLADYSPEMHHYFSKTSPMILPNSATVDEKLELPLPGANPPK